MENLMNIDSNRLFTSEIDVGVGELIHSKGQNVTDFGRTWEITKVTPKQVHCILKNLWFPVFEKCAFGRVAKGEDEDMLSWLNDLKEVQIDVTTAKFWKDGTRVGFKDDGVINVKVF